MKSPSIINELLSLQEATWVIKNPIVCQVLLYLLLGWGTIRQFIVWLNRFIVRVTFSHFVDKSSCFQTFKIRCDLNFRRKKNPI